LLSKESGEVSLIDDKGNQMVAIVAIFGLMCGIIVDQHFKLMRSFAQTDQALALVEQWKKIAESH